MIWAIVAAMGIAIAAGFGGFKLGVDHEFAAQKRTEDIVAAATEASRTAAALAISEIKVKNTTIKQEIRRETQTNTVYADCRHSPLGLLKLNEAITGEKPADSNELPKADPVK